MSGKQKVKWLDIFKIMIPILTVIIAGLMALNNMQENVRLEAQYKWKEDFRDLSIAYMEEFDNAFQIRFNNNLKRDELLKWLESNKNIEGTSEQEIPTNYMFKSPTSKLITIHKQMLFMINYEEEKKDELVNVHNFIVSYFETENYRNTDSLNDSNFSDVFYRISKHIYDNHKE